MLPSKHLVTACGRRGGDHADLVTLWTCWEDAGPACAVLAHSTWEAGPDTRPRAARGRRGPDAGLRIVFLKAPPPGTLKRKTSSS